MVGIVGKDCVVLGVEKKSIPTLQDDRTIRKIVSIHDHIMLAFAGLSADARVIVDYSRLECENYKLTLDDLPTLGNVALQISDLKQAYTQTGGRRPFGISTLLGGIDPDGTPRLFKTEPSGVFFEYLATTVGRNEKVIREYLELYYKDENIATEELVLKLAIKALSQAVQSVASNIEIAVISKNKEIIEKGREFARPLRSTSAADRRSRGNFEQH